MERDLKQNGSSEESVSHKESSREGSLPEGASATDPSTPSTDKSQTHEGPAEQEGGDPDASFHVVGIGASAGGLDALTKFFQTVRPDTGMAFVVVQHLSPDHKSMMGELLSKHTAMPVRQAKDGDRVERNRVYLIPPRKNMTLFHRQLFLADQNRDHGHVNYPIDVFLQSMAEDLGPAAIAVILSGTGSDGTRGLRMVKASGGLVIAQKTDTAQYGGMPQSAVSTGQVDWVLSPDEMPDALARYVRYPRRVREELQRAAEQEEMDATGMTKILGSVRKTVGVDFSAYKPTTVTRRIEHRMSIQQIDRIRDYAAYLENESEEVHALAREMLIGVTSFFRDTDAWSTLRQETLPDIIRDVQMAGRSAVRVWSVGCSTGEEAYTLAMLLHESLDAEGVDLDVKVFATDVDQTALRTAARGVYPDSIAADVVPERLQQYFVKTGEQYRVSRRLRQSVIFAPHDLLSDPPFSKLDLITCRNLLIYLKPAFQQKAMSSFGYALAAGGYLMLGKSENVGGNAESHFSSVHGPQRIFRYVGGRHPSAPISTDPVPDASELTRGPKNAPSVRRRRHPITLLEDVFEDVIKDHMPPAVVVNDRNQVRHVFGNADRFLRLPSGEADMDLLRMVDKSIRVLVGTALHRARKTGRRVVYAGIPVGDAADSERVDLIVDVQTTYDDVDLAVIVFNDLRPRLLAADSDAAYDVATYDIDADTERRIETLQRRLRYTEENLQATVEELETSNQELQATNEELMASNEELQSTNEELQSVNEELVTVNAELQEKIRKLTEVNNDLDNLLENVVTNSVFLDRDLCIRRFTSSLSQLIHLRPGDEGRPIHHLSHDFDDVDLSGWAARVIERETPIEQEAQAQSGRWYRVHVLPYRTAEARVDGVVITFQDVTAVKATEERLRREHVQRRRLDAYRRALDHVADAVFLVDTEMRVAGRNAAADALLAADGSVDAETTVDHLLEWDAPSDSADSPEAVAFGSEPWQGNVTLRPNGADTSTSMRAHWHPDADVRPAGEGEPDNLAGPGSADAPAAEVAGHRSSGILVLTPRADAEAHDVT